MYCRDFHAECSFWAMGAYRVQTWTAAIKAQLHFDVPQGPWHCYHQEKARLSRTVKPDSPNKGRFFLAVDKKSLARFSNGSIANGPRLSSRGVLADTIISQPKKWQEKRMRSSGVAKT